MKNIINYTKSFGQGFLTMSLLFSLQYIPTSYAADHLDSPRAILLSEGDITDLYVFNERQQSQQSSDEDRLCFVLNTNGLVPMGDIKHFASDISYQIKVSRGAKRTSADKVMEFRFGPPEEGGAQKITLNGQDAGFTTVGSNPLINNISAGGNRISIFAGEREDPFFFDLRVVKEGLIKGAPVPEDTFANTNVSSIVISVPMSYFQSDAKETTFSVWAVTSKI